MSWCTERIASYEPGGWSSIRRHIAMAAVLLTAVAAVSCSGPREDVVLFDFESGSLDEWTLKGENPFYGGGPVSADSIGMWLRAPEGFHGDFMLASGSPDGEGAYNPDGVALSPRFEITRDYLTFQLAGEVHPHVRVFLEVDGRIVREAFGNNFYDLVPRGWDVSALGGVTARIGVEDRSPRRSLIRLDHVVLSDNTLPRQSDWVRLSSRQRSPLVQPGEFRLLVPSDSLARGSEIVSSSIVRGHDRRWHMFAETVSGDNSDENNDSAIVHASASVLTGDWSYDGVMMTADSAIGESFLRQPFALFHDGLYYLYYIGSGTPWSGWRDGSSGDRSPSFGGKWGEQGPWRIHLATSADGCDWTRHGPVVTDTPFAFTPYVSHAGGNWVMYYAGADPPDIMGRHAVVTRVSSDLVHWSGRRVPVMTDHEFGMSPWPERSFVLDPMVFKRGDVWFLLAGPIDDENLAGRDCLRVFTSYSPMYWDITADHGRVFASRGSVIRDREGGWYITHNSIDSGGVWIAPLFWNDDLDGEPASIPAAE